MAGPLQRARSRRAHSSACKTYDVAPDDKRTHRQALPPAPPLRTVTGASSKTATMCTGCAFKTIQEVFEAALESCLSPSPDAPKQPFPQLSRDRADVSNRKASRRREACAIVPQTSTRSLSIDRFLRHHPAASGGQGVARRAWAHSPVGFATGSHGADGRQQTVQPRTRELIVHRGRYTRSSGSRKWRDRRDRLLSEEPGLLHLTPSILALFGSGLA